MSKFAKATKTMTKMIINTPQKPITPLTDEENGKHEEPNHCHICNEEFLSKQKR